MLKEKLDSRKCFATAWGKLITEGEAYRQLNRQIAAMTANLFQVMRIFEPSWEKRTAAICDIANMMNMAVAGTPEEQKDYVNASLYEAFNIPELCEKSSWLGGITGDSGDEWENMAGRVVQFTRNRVEKELDTCPWDIVGSELCNMTTSMFTANFDLASSNGTENEVALNMCQARGCGNKHCSSRWTPFTTRPGNAWSRKVSACATVSTPRISARKRRWKRRTTGSRRWAGSGRSNSP